MRFVIFISSKGKPKGLDQVRKDVQELLASAATLAPVSIGARKSAITPGRGLLTLMQRT